MKNTIEQKMTMIEEQLAQELNKSKSGKLGGKMLSLLGAVIGIAGVILGGKIVLVIIGGVLIGLGKWYRVSPGERQAGRYLIPLCRI